MVTDARLREIEFRTGFIRNPGGRLLCVNDPDRTAAPRFVILGSRDGNIAGIRIDIGDQVAAALLALSRQEPVLSAEPVHLAKFVELLSAGGEKPKSSIGLTHLLPHRLQVGHSERLVSSESEDGARLEDELSRSGMPSGLKEIGFHDVGEFWKPWCAALHEGEPVSVAFAARLSQEGASLGVATAPAFRGRGFATAATAGWTWSPSLKERALFYAHDRENRASHRITQKLGLRHLGLSFSLT